MSSTNKTANYELSQFVGTDIPSILNDYNGDMRKIDTALGEINASAGESASDINVLNSKVTQHTNQITTINNSVTSLNERVSVNETSISEISDELSDVSDSVKTISYVIPTDASPSNQLATKGDIQEYTIKTNLSSNTNESFSNFITRFYNIVAPLLTSQNYADKVIVEIIYPTSISDVMLRVNNFTLVNGNKKGFSMVGVKKNSHLANDFIVLDIDDGEPTNAELVKTSYVVPSSAIYDPSSTPDYKAVTGATMAYDSSFILTSTMQFRIWVKGE